MSSAATTVEQWKALNSHILVECRWGCKLSEQACRSYQSRAPRYIIHFNGSLDACSRVNADYIKCLIPDPCPHFVSDRDAGDLESRDALGSDALKLRRRAALHHARQIERLASPDGMLQEAHWHRSLVRR
jgi:hypothetical protein